MKPFRDSNEAAFRRLVREAIRKSTLTKSEKLVTLALADVWFYHKAKGEMHPGRDKIARRTMVSVKTVTRTMALLKAAGCLTPISHEQGGRAATRYRLHPLRLMAFCGVKFPDWIEGELVPISAGNVPLCETEMSRFRGDKMSHGNKGRTKTKKSEPERPSLRIVGGRDA